MPTEPAPAHTPGPTPTPAPRFSRRTLVVAAAVTAVVLVGGGVAAGLALAGDDDGPAAATSPTAADGDARPTADPTPAGDADSPCEVDYVVRDSWPGGFTVDVTVRNLAEPLDGWTLAWTFAGDERIENLWNAELEQPTADAPGPAVVVRSLGHNARRSSGSPRRCRPWPPTRSALPTRAPSGPRAACSTSARACSSRSRSATR